ncbi:MAG: MBL fold metallo-hydrolase [Chloroflexota bacterium]|nr:MBL fold metallo-hydrolase [Chloroflexota bacterium]
MAQVILLGTGAALSDETREHTYMVVQGNESAVLIDCGGGPVQRLSKAGVALDSIDHMILTHHHPDHLYGVSIFLLDLWLAGRKKVLHIYGLPETIRATRGMMHAFEWERWFNLGFFPVKFHRVTRDAGRPLMATPDFSISTSATKHLLPTLATRFESSQSGKAIVYSSDTEVCDSVVDLARDADILFHEATTVNKAAVGHSSARQAGAQAQRAGVKKLVLVHLPPNGDVEKLRAAAKGCFSGRVTVGKDFARYEF